MLYLCDQVVVFSSTILSLGNDPNLQYERQIFSDHHSSFPADWYPRLPSINEKALKIIVFLPGLGLTSRGKFCQKFLKYMAKHDYIGVVVNAKGVELPLRKAKFWHPGHYHDAKMVLDYIYSHFPNSSVYLVGYSAGSNILHKLMINYEKRQNFIKASMGICISNDYLSSRTALESSGLQGKAYSALLTLGYKHMIYRNQHIHDAIDSVALSKLLSSKFVSEYDTIAWKYLYGFDNEMDYYKALSSNFNDKRMNIPYLALQPRDDPLHSGNPRENIHYQAFYENPNIIYMEPQYGNHFGFYEGSILQAFSNHDTYTYPAKVALEFFSTINEKCSARSNHSLSSIIE